jgi:hypothetical protein
MSKPFDNARSPCRKILLVQPRRPKALVLISPFEAVTRQRSNEHGCDGNLDWISFVPNPFLIRVILIAFFDQKLASAKDLAAIAR